MSTTQRRKPDTAQQSPPPEKEKPAPKKQVSASSIAKTTLIVLAWTIVLFFMGSYLITESWTWGYRGKWSNINNYMPRKEIVFTEEELSRYDGTNPDLPIYVAIDGDVFDVTKGYGWYGKGGSYHQFAGRDAARAFVTGCFKDHLTHDLRGLSEKELEGVKGWKRFYQDHHTYYKVGRVIHAPIDPGTPIPKPCRNAVPQRKGSANP